MVAPVHLRGNIEIARKLISLSDFSQSYTSSILSFTEILERSTIDEIIESYEKCSFSGLDQSKMTRVWIMHSEHMRTELHCIIVNTHYKDDYIKPNRFQQYFHAKDQKLFRSWQELINLDYGLSSPFDPRRSRLESIPRSRMSEPRRELYERIDSLICDKILKKELSNRDDILHFLKKSGFEVKKNADYIGIRNFEISGKFLHLRGKKYKKGYHVNMPKGDVDFDNTPARRARLERQFYIELRKRQASMAKIHEDEEPLKPKNYRTHIHEKIDLQVSEKIGSGDISNRDELVKFVQSLGYEITKQAKASISIKSPSLGENPMRLKGEFYQKNYTFETNPSGTVTDSSTIITQTGDDNERDIRRNERKSKEPLSGSESTTSTDGDENRAPRGSDRTDGITSPRRSSRIRPRSRSDFRKSIGAILAIKSLLAQPLRVVGARVKNLFSDLKRRKDRKDQISRGQAKIQESMAEINRRNRGRE